MVGKTTWAGIWSPKDWWPWGPQQRTGGELKPNLALTLWINAHVGFKPKKCTASDVHTWWDGEKDVVGHWLGHLECFSHRQQGCFCGAASVEIKLFEIIFCGAAIVVASLDSCDASNHWWNSSFGRMNWLDMIWNTRTHLSIVTDTHFLSSLLLSFACRSSLSTKKKSYTMQ